MSKLKLSFSITIFCLDFAINSSISSAQIKPDLTLGGKNSVVEQRRSADGQKRKLIRGGDERGNNLFHSFQKFNIGVGEEVYFAPGNYIDNIFTRVTGNQASHISGKLGVLGKANLFFINPNGVVFGSKASLDLNGSLMVTTADKIVFADGSFFSAVEPNRSLLTVNVPIGLGFGSKSGDIVVKGSGHQLNFNVYYPVSNPTTETGLQVKPGNTLALLGGQIKLVGGVLNAPGGQIELASIGKGQVNFDTRADFYPSDKLSTVSKWKFSYEGVQSQHNITFKGKSAAIGDQAAINVHSKRLLISEGSSIFNQQIGLQTGNINIDVDFLDISGGKIETVTVYPGSPEAADLKIQGITVTKPFKTLAFTPSTIFAENLSNFSGGNIQILAQRVKVFNGGQLSTRAFNSGTSGNIFVSANNIELDGSSGNIGFTGKNIDIFSNISTSNFQQASSGNIQLTSKTVMIKGGSNIGSISFGLGAAGNINLNVTDSIQLIGFSPFSLASSNITSTSLSKGNSGEILIDTARLFLLDGGSIFTSAFAEGNAGQVTINASNIKLKGVAGDGVYPSQINSATKTVLSNFQKVFGLPEVPTGESGNVIINSRDLKVSDNAEISVQNQGFGDAGNLSINADDISLSAQGSISAATLSGEGGNIIIKSNNLTLQDSQITATSTEVGNGGNINIKTDIFIGLKKNIISANAFEGNGGNIQITAAGLFTSPNTLIQASSRLGIDGQVLLNVFEPVENSLTQLTVKLISPDAAITKWRPRGDRQYLLRFENKTARQFYLQRNWGIANN